MTPDELDAIEARRSDSELAPVFAALREAWHERDAYRKAKAENDERFMLERDEARAEVERLMTEKGMEAQRYSGQIAELEAEVEQWRRMAERREEALDALGAERNTWARQMADLHDERDDAARAKADAEARMREALDDRDNALDRAEKAEAAVARVRWGIDPGEAE